MNVSAIEQALGYTFQNKELLKRAFTLSSYAKTHRKESNERLEFLGDSILGFVISEREYLSKKQTEGEMTDARKRQVNDDTLHKIVEEMGLQEHLLYEGRLEDNVGKKPIASVFEAVVGAIYLDGGIEPCKAFIYAFVKPVEKREDYTTLLKEFLDRKGRAMTVSYEKKGKDNCAEHIAIVEAMGLTSRGVGDTKKEAKQQASKTLLQRLQSQRKK